MGIVISQPLDRLGLSLDRIVRDGGRLSIKYPRGWMDSTHLPHVFAQMLWGHIRGGIGYEDFEFIILERSPDVHP